MNEEGWFLHVTHHCMSVTWRGKIYISLFVSIQKKDELALQNETENVTWDHFKTITQTQIDSHPTATRCYGWPVVASVASVPSLQQCNMTSVIMPVLHRKIPQCLCKHPFWYIYKWRPYFDTLCNTYTYTYNVNNNNNNNNNNIH